VYCYFLESFEGAGNDGDDLFSTALPCLVLFHLFGFIVQTKVKHNSFGTIRIISQNNPYYNMLFEDYSDSCDTMYYIKAKKKFKCNTFTSILHISI
jgi:hypothetical protein